MGFSLGQRPWSPWLGPPGDRCSRWPAGTAAAGGPSGTPDEAAAAAERDGSADPDGDARADQAALLGASLAVVLTQFFGAGAWGWWSTGIGVTLLLIVLSYVRISRDHQLDKGRRLGRRLGFAP